MASGNHLSSTTCKVLFNHPTQGCAHDFPARLDHFLSKAGGALGSAERIVEERSVLPFYLRFASESMINATITAAAQSSSGRLKFQLGLLTSRFRANHPLKACVECMAEDMREVGTPYWRREHQLPGVWICRHHGGWLRASDLKATGVFRFQWVLPSLAQLGPAPEGQPAGSVLRLAGMVADVVAMTGLMLSPLEMGAVFRAVLGQRGLLTGPTLRLRHAAAGDAYAAFTAPLLGLVQLSGLPASSTEASTEIAKQITAEPHSIHPLRRLALAAWLFDGREELLATIAEARGKDGAAENRPPPTHEQWSDPRRDHFLALQAAGSSTSAAAREAGIDATTGMVWAAAAGLSTPRRPKLLKGEVRSSLILLLRKGVSKTEAAAYAKVSVQTVTTLLRTEVGLNQAWKQAGFENARRRNRRRWERITAANPLSGVKAARMTEPAVYTWLYRNDRDWLNEKVAGMARAVRAPQMRVDWDVRDRQLADQVRETALRLVNENGVRRIRLFQLYQRIPELRAKLFKLDRLPLTRAAIFAVLGRTAEVD